MENGAGKFGACTYNTEVSIMLKKRTHHHFELFSLDNQQQDFGEHVFEVDPFYEETPHLCRQQLGESTERKT